MDILFIQRLIIIVILVLLFGSISITIYTWLANDTEYYQRVINTYYILFGGNVIISISMFVLLYLVLPDIVQTIDNVNNTIIPALTSGIANTVKDIASPLAKKILRSI